MWECTKTKLDWASALAIVGTVFIFTLAGCADSIDQQDAWDDESQRTHLSQKAYAGDSCASGCIWSTFAVALGAQSGTATCSGQSCACVMEGDIWSICAAQSTAPRPNNPSSNRGSSTSATAGASCASGCIWSTFAVSIGVQDEAARCNGVPCACVVDGDVWSTCNATGAGASSASSNNSVPSPSFGGRYNAAVGNQIADAAYRIATRRNTVGYCYSAAADAIETVTGPFLWGSSAYLAANQLRDSAWFYEVSVGSLRNLPAGAVVVWGKGRSPHGHISVALGDGREASDHVAWQMTYHYGGAPARVFYPQ